MKRRANETKASKSQLTNYVIMIPHVMNDMKRYNEVENLSSGLLPLFFIAFVRRRIFNLKCIFHKVLEDDFFGV